jgi:hypothetical protein
MVPTLVPNKELGERFTICARGPVTGMVLGLLEWAWCPIRRAYLATGDYLCGWREAVKDMYAKTGELFIGRAFRPNVTRLHFVPSTLTLSDAA